MSKIDLRPLMNYIDPVSATYDEWLAVGMALEHEGYPYQVWDEWSRKDPTRYIEGECEKKYITFRGNPTPVTGATIVQMAKSGGWVSTKRQTDSSIQHTTGRIIDWDDAISDDTKIVDSHYVENAELQEPKDGKWQQIDDLIRYLEAVFRPSDYVGVVMGSMEAKDKGRFFPAGRGTYTRTAGEYINNLRRYRETADNPDAAVRMAFEDYDRKAGAWIRFNPLDGNGVKNENVAEFRYALVESDHLPPGKQKSIMEQMELPIVAMVHSGNKSIHAIVRVDAGNYEEYRRRVDYLYKVCNQNGLQVDVADRNPSRLSRLPGILRGKRKQWLIATNIGKSSYQEWKEWIETVNDDLPEPEGLNSVWDNLPELSPPLINNVLRQGHKMLLAGSSKAGKSFALIQLCVAIAEGTEWLGNFQCTQGRVMYVNLELDRASCLHRFKDVYTALNLPPDNIGNIDIWNLRGKAIPMDKLAPKLIRRANKKNYIAIVIDPIYKVITGDENSADQMAKFCNQFDKVCNELNCAVIYCHHHSKGGQGMKRAMDRASGSGVFARDPDAILDMIQLNVKDERSQLEKQTDKSTGHTPATAWRIAGTLREFPSFDPVNIWFDYPIHLKDKSGVLRFAVEEGSLEDVRQKGRELGNKIKTAVKKDRQGQLEAVYNDLTENGKHDITLKEFAEYFDVSEKTIRRDITATNKFYISDFKVFRK